jgi:hypothetical protein
VNRDRPLGELLLDLVGGAREELVLCAPFIKTSVAERILEVLPTDVRIVAYTRWRPEEVAAGVSDLQVLEIVHAAGGQLNLFDPLHAKYYRADEHVLIGSANLTGRALGWTTSPNLELLVNADVEAVSALERTLVDHSIQATSDLARRIEEAAALLPRAPLPEELVPRDKVVEPGWIPQIRQPGDLFAAYRDGTEQLSSLSRTAARIDLQFLDLPPGLDRATFNDLVGQRLEMHPLFVDLDEYLGRPRRFGEIRRHLEQKARLDRHGAEVLSQTVMRWLMEFLPQRYSRDVHRWSEVLTRRGSDDE